jgi:uncharacterized protein DUF6438
MLRILFLLALLGAASPAASGPGAGAPLSDAELREVVITLERGMCYGECPVYKIRITGDGRISYQGEMFVEAQGNRTRRIPLAEVRDLVATFEKVGYFSIGQDYTYNNCQRDRCKRGYMSDASSAVTSITLRGKTHRVAHDFGCGCAPAALFDVEAAIDKASQADRWVGKDRGSQWAGSEN